MKNIPVLIVISALFAVMVFAQTPKPANIKDIVEIEMLTHSEISDKIHNEGKTSVLIVTGGTEERGPHDVLGGHTFMARNKGVEIAKKLGNALVANRGQQLHVAGSLSVDRYQGAERVQFRVIDVALPDQGPSVIR